MPALLDAPISYLGEYILDLIDEEYEDPEEGVLDCIDALGGDEELFDAIMEGELPATTDEIDAIASVFESTSYDEELYEDLHDCAHQDFFEMLEDDEIENLVEVLEEVDEELVEAYEDELSEEDDEDFDEDEDYDDDIEDEYDEYDEDFDEDEEYEEYDEYEDEADDLTEAVVEDIEESSYRIAQLENQIAEFQMAAAVNSELNELMDYAEVGLQEGWLLPSKYNALFGELDGGDEERLATFSALSHRDRVPVADRLNMIRYSLQLDEMSGGYAPFSAYVEEEIDPEELAVLEAYEEQAALNNELLRENGVL